MSYALQINGVRRPLDVDGDTSLLWVIRDILGLTGTRAYQCADRAALTLRPHMRSRYLRFTQTPSQTSHRIRSHDVGLAAAKKAGEKCCEETDVERRSGYPLMLHPHCC